MWCFALCDSRGQLSVIFTSVEIIFVIVIIILCVKIIIYRLSGIYWTLVLFITDLVRKVSVAHVARVACAAVCGGDTYGSGYMTGTSHILRRHIRAPLLGDCVEEIRSGLAELG